MLFPFRQNYFIHASASSRFALTVIAAGAFVVAPTQSWAASTSNAFNPAVSVILNGTMARMDRDPASYTLPGFSLANEVGPGTQGFSLGESELTFSANVDDQLYASLITTLTGDGSANVEEAVIETTSLGNGLTLRGGRFFSDIGYLNDQHAHVWDFVDMPLAYAGMLGNQFNDDGVQARWLAPTDLFLEFGGEWFRGDHFPAGGAANKGKGAHSVFVHTGGDVGDSNSWRVGLSRLNTQSTDRTSLSGADSFSGHSNITVLDAVWKWSPHGNATDRYLKLQGEYLHRDENGTFNANAYDGTQNGWYVQGVYQFMPRWRAGIRHDTLHADSVADDLVGTILDSHGYDPKRNSVMVDFSNSEFSRVRLQFNRDQSSATTDNQWYLQYIAAIGAHGAHKY